MKNILPKSSIADRGEKIDPNMRGVLEEQDVDLAKGLDLEAENVISAKT